MPTPGSQQHHATRRSRNFRKEVAARRLELTVETDLMALDGSIGMFSA